MVNFDKKHFLIFFSIFAISTQCFGFGPSVPEQCRQNSDAIEELFKLCRQKMTDEGKQDKDFDVGLLTLFRLSRKDKNLSPESIAQKIKIRDFMKKCRRLEAQSLLDKQSISTICFEAIVNQATPLDSDR